MVCAALAREAGFEVLALTDRLLASATGSSSTPRRESPRLLAERHVVLPLDLRAFGGSALTSDVAVPKDGA